MKRICLMAFGGISVCGLFAQHVGAQDVGPTASSPAVGVSVEAVSASSPANVSVEKPAADRHGWDNEDGDFKDSLARLKRELPLLPIGAEARRQTIDLLMLATAVGDAATVEQCKRDLLIHYPSSVEATYAMTLFTDAKGLRAFLDKQFLKDISTYENALQAVRVVKRALPIHKKGLLEDPQFALKLTCAALMVGDRGLCNQCRNLLKDRPAQVARVACDEVTPIVERFNELHSLLLKSEFADQVVNINLFETCLYQAMTVAERDQPTIRRIMARNFSLNGQLEAALILFEQLSAEGQDPQLLFQHGACLARLRRSDEARDKLQHLRASFPDSTWSRAADVVLANLDDLDARIDQYVTLLTNCLATYRSMSIELCDLDIFWRPKTDGGFNVTLGLDFKRNFIEVMARSQGELWWAVKCQADDSTIFMKGERTIYKLQGFGLLPSASLENCALDSKGEFHGTTNFSMGKSLASLQTALKDGLANDKLCSPTALKLLVGGLVRSGNIFLPLQEEGDQKICRILRVDLDTAEVYSSTIQFDAQSALESAKFDSRDTVIELRKIMLGNAKSHRLTAGVWPKLPLKLVQQNDAATLMHLFAVGAELLKSAQTPAATANNPADATAPVSR